MARTYILFLVGLVAGVGGTLLALRTGGAPPAPVAPTLEAENAKLKSDLDAAAAESREAQDQLRAARRTIADLERAAAAPAAAVPAVEPRVAPGPQPAGAAAPTEEELMAGVMEFGQALQSIILGDGGGEAKAKFQELLRRAGPEGMRALIEKFRSGDLGFGPKTVLAHALAQSGDPAALKALEDVLKDPDAGLVDHRLASHGLAFIDDRGVVPTLLKTAREDPDQGARANAAFGLARRGEPEGMKLYAAATDAAFEKGDPAALQYLSGFHLLGKAAAPMVRERLDTYKDPQARIVLIELLRAAKDVDSIPRLRAMQADATVGKDVRDAAENALRELEAN